MNQLRCPICKSTLRLDVEKIDNLDMGEIRPMRETSDRKQMKQIFKLDFKKLISPLPKEIKVLMGLFLIWISLTVASLLGIL